MFSAAALQGEEETGLEQMRKQEIKREENHGKSKARGTRERTDDGHPRAEIAEGRREKTEQ